MPMPLICTSSALLCTSFTLDIHSEDIRIHSGDIKYTLKIITYTLTSLLHTSIFTCISHTLLHNIHLLHLDTCCTSYSPLCCSVNVTSGIDCANDLICFHNLFQFACMLFEFVMLSPASIIYADLSNLAQVKMS